MDLKLEEKINFVKDAKLRDYVMIETATGSYICQVSILKTQLSNFSIKLRTDSTCFSRNYEVNFGNYVLFRKCDIQNVTILKSIKATKVKIALVYTNDDFKNDKVLAKSLRYILKNYGLKSNTIVHCENHPLAKLTSLALMSVEIDNLRASEVAKVGSNTEIEITSEMDIEHYTAIRASSTQNLNKPFCNEETELKVVTQITSILRCGSLYSPLGLQGTRGLLVIDPTSFQLNQLINKCIFKCGAIKITISATEILREAIGESEFLLKKKLLKAVKWSSVSKVAIVLEDMDSIFPKSSLKLQSSISKRILSIFLSFLDDNLSSNLIVIGTLRSTDELHPALLRPGRMDKKIVIGNLIYQERLKILNSLIKKNLIAEDVKIEEMAEKTPGFGVPDLLNLWQHIVFTHLESLKKRVNQSTKISSSVVKGSLLAVRPTAYKSHSNWNVQISPIDWDEIVGMEKIKTRIQMAIEWPLLHGKAFKRLGLNHPKGVLLFGPPGCCKTTLIRGVASMCKTTFLSATPAQIFSPYVGDSSKAITEIFEAARLATPALIFLDEIDSLVGSRQFDSKMRNAQRGAQEQVLSTLLNEMDGIGVTRVGSSEKGNVIVIGVTNRFDLLDAALLRPGRFDTIVYVGAPNSREKKAILSKIIEKLPTQGVNVDFLSEETKLFSGADLKNLCQEAALNALDENLNSVCVCERHFDYALKNTQASLSLNQLSWFNEICRKNNIPMD